MILYIKTKIDSIEENIDYEWVETGRKFITQCIVFYIYIYKREIKNTWEIGAKESLQAKSWKVSDLGGYGKGWQPTIKKECAHPSSIYFLEILSVNFTDRHDRGQSYWEGGKKKYLRLFQTLRDRAQEHFAYHRKA